MNHQIQIDSNDVKQKIAEVQHVAENWSPQRALTWAFETFGNRVAISSAFGAEGMVLIDMASRVRKGFRLFTIDTEFLFPETYNLMDRIEEKYGIAIEKVYPVLSPEEQERTHGTALWTRDPETDVLAACRKLGVGFVPYSPLGRGFLTGAIKSPDDFTDDDYRKQNPRFQGENFAKNLVLVEKVQQLARAKGVPASQLALAWVLAQGDDLVPIPGTKRRKYLDENVGALEVTLSAAELEELGEVFPPDVAAGSRYPEQAMGLLNG